MSFRQHKRIVGPTGIFETLEIDDTIRCGADTAGMARAHAPHQHVVPIGHEDVLPRAS